MSALNEKPNAEPLAATAAAGAIVEGRYLPPPEDKNGKSWVRTSALIQREPDELYSLWRDLSAAPGWQEKISRVDVTGERTSHWVMTSDGKTIEWNSEILEDEPGKRIAWHSTGGALDHAGEVVFDEASAGRGTLVTVLQEFHMGKLASAWETLVGRNPKQVVVENLRHFKALAETGEIPRTQGQPHGERGLAGKAKASAYAETTPTPVGTDRIAS